jgi:hypothetical protein
MNNPACTSTSGWASGTLPITGFIICYSGSPCHRRIPAMLLSEIQSTDFVPCLHQTFRICLEGLDPIDLELVEVQELGEPQGPSPRRPFALHFLGPVSHQYLVQHIYPLEHEQWECWRSFLCRSAPKRDGCSTRLSLLNPYG